MNFIKFPANTTNIFPIANSKTGGQLLTEFNLRSRESVLTPESVKYMIGPSYCHSTNDFIVRLQQDELGVSISSTALEITDGRALVNGHYFESLTNVVVDIAEANRQLKSQDKKELKGKLAVGLRAMYSTEQTLSSSMRIENNNHMVTGVQIVILPYEEGVAKPGYFVLPENSPDQEDLVTAHLLLATFYYTNGQIRSISQNNSKVQAIPASRVGSFGDLLSDHYLTKDGLNPKKIYTLAGKSEDGTTLSGKPTWCDSTDSLFIWQPAPKLRTVSSINPDDYQINSTNYVPDDSLSKQYIVDPSVLKQADFFVSPKTEEVILALPHKSVDGKMWNTAGEEEYYDPRILRLPQASYSAGTPGTITSDYTRSVKAINDRLNQFYQLSKGRQRGYIDTLNSRTVSATTVEYDSTEEGVLPKINKSWRPGDYVLVNKDNTVVDDTSDLIQAPSTMYVVLPPLVTKVILQDTEPRYSIDDLPVGHDGVEIMRRVRVYPGSESDDADTVTQTIADSFNFEDVEAYNQDFGIDINYTGEVSTTLRGMYKQMSKTSVYAVGTNASTGEATPPILLEGYEGSDEYYDYQDYIVLEVLNVPYTDTSGSTKLRSQYYYFAVAEVKPNSEAYSDPVLLTGTIPLATEDTIGGFYNVSETDLDNGYVIRDSDGNLKLLDYSLLRSGVLAYQLGQDYEFGSGLTAEEIQSSLDEYVNDRVAFPTEEQKEVSLDEGRDEKIIQITLNLSQEDSTGSITLRNIDSRWGTSVHLFITGDPNYNTTINIVNCEKIRISFAIALTELDLESGLGPVVNIYNSNVWYDSTLIDMIHRCRRVYASQVSESSDIDVSTIYPDGFNGIEGMQLWYEKSYTDDANLLVEGMTVTEVKSPIIPEEIDFWSESVVNDNHYYYGLQSVTFDPSGEMVGCGLYLRNDTTSNIDLDSKSISLSKFELPQGSGLAYPETSVVRPIKVTGQFINAFAQTEGYIVTDTKFTALTQTYSIDENYSESIESGTISFLSESALVSQFISTDDLEQGAAIDGWENNSYHVFKGWVIG